jgi:predicted nucleotidyltransferase
MKSKEVEMVDSKRIQALSNRIIAQFKPEKVILFGSHAYGNPGIDSDVDLLVIMKFDGKNAIKAAEILNTINPNFPVDLIVRTPDQVRERLSLGDFFIREILEKGTVLYEAAYA